MSYIRSSSNPEGLYIWGGQDSVEISVKGNDVWKIPYDVFNGLIKKFHRNFHDYPCKYKGAQVEEVWVCDEQADQNDITSVIVNSRSKIKFTYMDKYITMWDVTWEYIVNSNIYRFKTRRKTISMLPIDIQKAVDKEIKSSARYEAITILLLTTEDRQKEFLKYHREDKGNLCCLLLDKAKEELVQQGILKENKHDNFGNLW